MGAEERRNDPPLGGAEVLGTDGAVTGVVFAMTKSEGGRLVETGETFTLAADMVLKAIGQSFVVEPVGAAIELERGRIRADEDGHLTAKVWAGGDLRYGGLDLTVDAVAQGVHAAQSIDAALRG